MFIGGDDTIPHLLPGGDDATISVLSIPTLWEWSGGGAVQVLAILGTWVHPLGAWVICLGTFLPATAATSAITFWKEGISCMMHCSAPALQVLTCPDHSFNLCSAVGELSYMVIHSGKTEEEGLTYKLTIIPFIHSFILEGIPF